MRKMKKVNWLPVLVVLFIVIGLVLIILGYRQGTTVILAAFPFSILEVARISSERNHALRK